MTDREPPSATDPMEHLQAELREAREEIDRLKRSAADEQVHTQRMAALGQLLAGIMHEIKTPVGAIASAQDTLSRAMTQLEDALDQASPGLRAQSPAVARALRGMGEAGRVIGAGVARTLGIIDRVRSAARGSRVGREEIDLCALLDETLELLGHETRGQIQVVRQYESGMPAVTCNRGEVGQVLLNVLSNAIQAVRGDGTIVVRTETHEGEAHLIVEDTGVGIAPEHLPRIFDRGFSTKPEQEGSGLGLSISRELVERQGGRIDVASELQKGTRVTIVLPL